MSKAVLISIQPKWCELILRGKKTVEVRKSKPKLKPPFKCYIYCTYGNVLIEHNDIIHPDHLAEGIKVSKNKIWDNCCNGKVIGEFVCDEIETLRRNTVFNAPALYSQSCLTRDEYFGYIGNKTAYIWHISDLVIYDKPKELFEFGIKKAPQSWCYVEEC